MLEGEFNYNKTPIAPPGTKALIYQNPSIYISWSPHALDAWYVRKLKNIIGAATYCCPLPEDTA